MRNIKLLIAYEGSHYLGWQKTNLGRSIEGELQRVLSKILQENIELQAASRTDAGVHAAGQVINFATQNESINLTKLKFSLNRLLPKDIVVLESEDVAENFHSTLNCISKEYHYFVCYDQVQLPVQRYFSWHYPSPLNLYTMRTAAQTLLGEHDFSSFCNFKKNQHYKHYVRNLLKLDITELGNKQLRFEVQGNHFLYKMVRNIIGTLIYVGCGKIPQEKVGTILVSKDRTFAGVTAPAHGLFLFSVNYKM
jgi:tRNA pseudouridine38-40 synthase